MKGNKESTLQEVLPVAECPSHPSESLTIDTREANPALSTFHQPTLSCAADTCHALVIREDRVNESAEKHGEGDKLRQLHGNPCCTGWSSQSEPLE